MTAIRHVEHFVCVGVRVMSEGHGLNEHHAVMASQVKLDKKHCFWSGVVRTSPFSIRPSIRLPPDGIGVLVYLVQKKIAREISSHGKNITVGGTSDGIRNASSLGEEGFVPQHVPR